MHSNCKCRLEERCARNERTACDLLLVILVVRVAVDTCVTIILVYHHHLIRLVHP